MAVHPIYTTTENSKTQNTKNTKTTTSTNTIFKYARPNLLHKFASYIPLWTLSALSQGEIQEPKRFWNSRPHDMIVRSAGLGDANSTHWRPNPHSEGTMAEEVKKSLNKRAIEAMDEALNEYKKQRDLYFESVRVNSLPPFNEDRPLSSVTKIEMVINEPMGISLLKRLRAAAANNGYADHVDAPYMLTLEFRGWNEKGQEISKDQTALLKRVIPVKIVNLQLDVSQNGTVYNLRAIPYNEFGYLNQYAYLRTSGQLTKDAKLADTLQELQNLLNKQNKDEKDYHYLVEDPDEYVLKVHPLFGEQKLIINQTIGSIKMNDQSAPPGKQDELNRKLVGQVKAGDHIMTILTSLMKMIEGFGDDVLEEWKDSVLATATVYSKRDTKELNPNERAHMAVGDDFYFNYFQIRTSVVPQKLRWDRFRKTHPKIITYYIEPFKINGKSLAIPGVSVGKEQIPFVYKNYNYIFTGENVDILDLNINYKVAYYQSKLKNINAQNERRINIVEPDKRIPSSPEDSFAGDDFLTKSEVDGAKSMNASMNSEGGGIVDQFMDSLTHPTADMVRVEMQILGDIAYMGQAQFMPPSFKGKDIIDKDGDISYFRGTEGAIYNNKLDAYNPDVADPVVNLRFRFPTDQDTHTGLYELSDEDSATFSGLYRVYKVDNNFEQGQFTQVLHMVRFLNQGDFVTEDIKLVPIETKIDGTRVGPINVDAMAKIWMTERNRFFEKVKKRASKTVRDIKGRLWTK